MSKKHLPNKLHNVLPYLGVVVGVVVLLSPVLANLVESWRASHTVSEATTAAAHITEEGKAELLQQAHAYNDDLCAHTSSDGVWPYPLQLSWESSPIMCWVEIPRIDVRLGVYHGTGATELTAGAGHMEGSSLPVGGASTHCVISAHSGMPTERMFDNIRDLEPGDVFVLWTLDEPYAYRVTGSEVVEPNDASSLAIERGKDLCTLITCTPYGVNSHRLLVHAERCSYEEAQQETAPAMYVSPSALPLVLGLVVAGGALAFTSWRVVSAQRKKKKERE